MNFNKKAIIRFHEKYIPEPNSGCWLWVGSMVYKYGSFNYLDKSYRAHRVSYKMFVGDIPEGMLVCHRCDVRSCVNPNHLFLGTFYDNYHDMLTKGRGRKPRITPEAGRWIMENYKKYDREWGRRGLAKKLNVSLKMIKDAIKRIKTENER